MKRLTDPRLKLLAERARAHVPARIRQLEHRVASPAVTAVLTANPAPGVLEIRLAGGTRRNVLGRSTIARIESLVEFAPEATNVVLITTEGPDFCAGYDLLEAAAGDAGALLAHDSNFAPLRRSPRPVVAALSGNVIGGGLELALAADVRIAARDTRFAIPACALGLVYSESGTRLLVEALGESIARAMLLGGRALSASEALALGLVSELVAPDELAARAHELATQIAAWSPVATAGNRQVLDAVTGRAVADVAALHATSFAEGGALAGAIAAFVARRQQATVSSPSRVRQIGAQLTQSCRSRAQELARTLVRLRPTS